MEGLQIVGVGSGEDGVLSVRRRLRPRRRLRRTLAAGVGAVWHGRRVGSVRERRDGDAAVFEVVTGIPDNAGLFVSDGHALG